MEMAEVDMAIYGKTVSLIGEMDNIMVAKEAIEMILNGSRHKSVYGFLEHKKERGPPMHKSVKNGQLKKRASYGRIKVLP